LRAITGEPVQDQEICQREREGKKLKKGGADKREKLKKAKEIKCRKKKENEERKRKRRKLGLKKYVGY
jgi:hypothetical protein